MSKLLTEKEVSVYVNDLNAKQEAMIEAIKGWQHSKQIAVNAGLDLYSDDQTFTRWSIFPIVSVKYSHTLFYKL